MRKGLAGLVLLASASALAGTVGTLDVWPDQVRALPDGSVEYRYSLASLTPGAAPSETRMQFGEDEIAAFLARVPEAVTVKLQPTARKLLLEVGEVEHAPLVGSFETLSDRRAGVIPGLDMLLWKARQFEDGAIATLELAAEDGTLGLPLSRPALWSRILDSSLKQYFAAAGDEKEGALLLVKRIGAADRLVAAPLPWPLRRDRQLMAEVEAELRMLEGFEPQLGAMGPFRLSERLRRIYVRDWVLAQPLPMTRAGLAAALFLMDTIEGNPKLARTYAGLEELRDSLHGPPGNGRLRQYHRLATGGQVARAIDNLPVLVEELSTREPTWQTEVGPALFAAAENPLSRFLASLDRHEQAQGWEELALAAQEGRVNLAAAPAAPWETWRESTFVALLNPIDASASGLSFGPAYRSRVLALFEALHGAHWQPPPLGRWSADVAAEAAPPPALKVRLRIAPQLRLEPSAGAFGRIARADRRLAEVISSFGGAGELRRLLPDGRRTSETLLREAEAMEVLFHGFELLSADARGADDDLAPRDDRAVAEARRYLRHWRADPDLREDVRSLQPHQTGKADAVHAGVFGIGWRSLQVQFADPPSATLTEVMPEDAPLFELDSGAAAAYSIPSLVTGAVVAPSNASLGRRAFRALCDRAKGDPVAIEAALLDALSGSIRVSQRWPLEELGRNPLHHPRERDGLTHVVQPAQPSHGAFHP